MAWIDKILYWAWEESDVESKKRLALRDPIPEVPWEKILDYVTINKAPSPGAEFKLCIGVVDEKPTGSVYKKLHRDELEFHLKSHTCSKESMWPECRILFEEKQK